SSAEVAVSTERRILATAGFLVAMTPQGGTGSAVLTGRITDVAGRPVQDAQVAVEGGKQITRTAADGTFRLTELPSGTTNASVRKIGFAPAQQAVHLRRSEPQSMALSLSAAARALAPVTITAEADKALDKLGFTERLKMGNKSNFVLPEEMKKYENLKLTDIFRSMPGFIVQKADNNNSILASSRAVNGGQQGCVEIFVDRIPFEQMAAGDLDAAFPPYTIAAIESYPSPATTPIDFRMSGKACATVVIWTKLKLNRQ
ncbi:MAG TPA: carboxypeptidase-like regulatory domain-containing protein, partial [Gemmatimonadaceae bacterium]|nr:carboxypeptidase-like regulatory domain-containing protein [Gemmatimonadaceae bacterium]